MEKRLIQTTLSKTYSVNFPVYQEIWLKIENIDSFYKVPYG